MKIGIRLILSLVVMVALWGCKKDAPGIDLLVGTYKVSGWLRVGGFTQTLNDTLLRITKADNWTIQFMSSSCDSTFRPIALVYYSQNDTSIEYQLLDGNSPNAAVILFPTQLTGSFTYRDEFYCSGAANTFATLYGTKVQ